MCEFVLQIKVIFFLFINLCNQNICIKLFILKECIIHYLKNKAFAADE